MTMTPEEKIWTVAEAIASAYEITSSGEVVYLHPVELHKKIGALELEQILDKFVKDYAVIQITRSPSQFEPILDNYGGCYGFQIPDRDRFRNFLNSAHAKFSGGVERLDADNFLAICDVAMDINSELQITSGQIISIPLMPSIIRFSRLLPAKSVSLLDRYGDYRMKALVYMKVRGIIESCEVVPDMSGNRWDREITVRADRFDFDKFYNRLMSAYQIRVVEPAKKNIPSEKKPKNSKKSGQKDPPIQKIEITAMPPLQVNNVEDAPAISGKRRIHLPKFPPTDWSKITAHFTDEQNVIFITDKDQKPVNYEALDMADRKRNRPNMAWAFFLTLARNNGETKLLNTPIPDAIKQVKRQLSDRLKLIFKNDTDPFYDPTESRTYRIKIKVVPPPSLADTTDELGIEEYMEETSTEN